MAEAVPSSHDAPPDLSIVIPAYNEQARLGSCLSAWGQWLGARGTSAEIIVVDDGSEDATATVARQFDMPANVTVHVLINERNAGKGASVRRGMGHSRGAVLLLCDADLNVPAEELPHLTDALEDGFDVAIGSRLIARGKVHRPMFRRFTSWLFYAVRALLLLPDIHDTQCGFKAFGGDAGRAIFKKQTLDGYGFDLEVLAIARWLGYSIKEVPVHWEVREGSKVRPIRDGLALLADVWRVRRKWGRASRADQ